MSMSACCAFCSFFSFMGVVFYGITAVMIARGNKVFLTHKAGLDLHNITEEETDKLLWTTLYTVFVSEQIESLSQSCWHQISYQCISNFACFSV